MIRGYFGVPGCGKTTILTSIGLKEFKRIKKGKSPYKSIVTINFNINIDEIKTIEYDDLANYKFYDTLVLIDEITLLADNRKFKTFSDLHRDFFVLHRHLNIDIIYATQNFEAVDSKIRYLTMDLWYMSKSVVPLLSELSTAKRIYRKICINEYSSELLFGYRFCNFLEALFVSNFKIVFRRRFYKYFNSFDELGLEHRPILSLPIIRSRRELRREKIKYFINNISSKLCFRK